MSDKKLLPDVTRRDVLKGIAKGAAASQAPISGLSSLVKGVKTGLDIHKKLDLTKNIIQELLFLNKQFKEGDKKKYSIIKSVAWDFHGNLGGTYVGPDFSFSVSGEKIKQIEDKDKIANKKDFLAIMEDKKITKEDLTRILNLVDKENKVLAIAQKYNLPLNHMLQTDQAKKLDTWLFGGDYRSYQDLKVKDHTKWLEEALEEFTDTKSDFLKEYNTPDENIPRIAGVHGGKFRQEETFNEIYNKVKEKYGHRNAYDLHYIYKPSELPEVNFNDPLVKEYLQILKNQDRLDYVTDKDRLEEMSSWSFSPDWDVEYEKSMEHNINNPEAFINTIDDNTSINWIKNTIGDFFKDYAGKKLKEVFEKQPKEQVKQLPEPEAIEVEVQNKKEIPVQAEQEAPVPPGNLGKILKRTPYIGGVLTAITPTQMGDAELKIKDQQGNLIQKRKGGTVMKNYYKNYNTQRTI